MERVRFRCQQCGKRLKAPVKCRGLTYRCPICRRPAIVPGMPVDGRPAFSLPACAHACVALAKRASGRSPFRKFVFGALCLSALLLLLFDLMSPQQERPLAPRTNVAKTACAFDQPLSHPKTAPVAESSELRGDAARVNTSLPTIATAGKGPPVPETPNSPSKTPTPAKSPDLFGDVIRVATSLVADVNRVSVDIPAGTVNAAENVPDHSIVKTQAKQIPVAVTPATRGAELERPTQTDRPKVEIKRRHDATDDDLRKQLFQVPEIGLDSSSTQWLMTTNPAYFPNQNAVEFAVKSRRLDLAGLPFHKGPDCRLGKDSAEHLQALSHKLRTHLERSIVERQSISGPRGRVIDPRPDPDILRKRLLAESREWLRTASIPTLQQMLIAENESCRLLLIEILAEIPGRDASRALAARAVSDLHPDVRQAAVTALRSRPPHEYVDLLLKAFRYPWPAFADHAAEAIVALDLRDYEPALREMLVLPDPKLPSLETVNNQKTLVTRELVRINHLGNCLLCHARSVNPSDLVRGNVPIPGRVLPNPQSTQYYDRANGVFVRADIVYLRQDFSVAQPIENSGAWPSYQRYDYLVRSRPATPTERQAFERAKTKKADNPIYRQKVALEFALSELTGNQ